MSEISTIQASQGALSEVSPSVLKGGFDLFLRGRGGVPVLRMFECSD